jgi:hypothetical protein
VGATTQDVDCKLTGDGSELQLTVTLSRAYLDDPSRVFPVVLDPDWPIYPPNVMDTCVCSGNPTTTYGSDSSLRTGWSSETGTRWTLIWFNLTGVNVNPDWIDYCYIRLKKKSNVGVTPVVRAYPCTNWWDSTTATWYNKPGVAWEHLSTESAPEGNDWWRMYSTYPVRRWLSGAWGNCGWTVVETRLLHPYGTWYWSANNPPPDRPELHIFYTQGGSSTEDWEMGVWAYSRDANGNVILSSADDIVEGIRDTLQSGSEFDSYLTKLEWDCQERRLRDPSKPFNGVYDGDDDISGVGFDSVDFAVFAGHGTPGYLEFPYLESSIRLIDDGVLWGNTDLEWAYILACQWLNPTSSTELYWDKVSMAGAHGICGYVDNFIGYHTSGEPDPDPRSRDQGAHFARYLMGEVTGFGPQSFWGAFRLANNEWQPAGTTLRCLFAPTCYDDRLPKRGGMSAADPSPYASGGDVFIEEHDCSGKVH